MSQSGSGSWHRFVPWVGLAVAIGALVAHAVHFDFINDDAFISFRYADNLVQHGELNYNVGDRCEGYTNFLWTVLIAGVLALGFDPVPWSKGLGVFFGAGTLTAVFVFSRWFARSVVDEAVAKARSDLWWCVAPGLLAITSAFAAWSEGGLETSLFTFLVTVGLLRSVAETTDESLIPWSGAVLGLAAMTRPDGLLIIGLAGIFRGLSSLAVRRTWKPAKQDVLWAVGFLAVFLPYWLWRYSYYGYIFPNTYYAKGSGSLWEPGLRYVWGFVRDCNVWVALMLLAVPWRGASQSWRFQGLVVAVALPFCVYVAKVGGDFMALYRFLVPLLPLFALAAQEGAASLWGSLREDLLTRGASRTQLRVRAGLVTMVLVASLGWHNANLTRKALEVGSERGVDSIGWLKMFVEQTTAIGKHLKATYPPETSLATTAAGVIPYYSRMRTLDLLALNDVHTAHNVKARGSRPGHSKRAPERYVLDWKPTLLVWHPRMSKTQPRASATERRYWQDRGYKFMSTRVPGLNPPYWSWFEKSP